jgi:hypothetical protein
VELLKIGVDSVGSVSAVSHQDQYGSERRVRRQPKLEIDALAVILERANFAIRLRDAAECGSVSVNACEPKRGA